MSKLSNEFGCKFNAYGPWLRTDNDIFPLGIYAKPEPANAHIDEDGNPVREHMTHNGGGVEETDKSIKV
jgi:hypothetical protein